MNLPMLNSNRQIASKDKVVHTLNNLFDLDLAKLRSLAKLYVIGMSTLSWQELLNEAIQRTLEGRRQWPIDVPFIAFLAQTMKSIANEEWQRIYKEPVTLESDLSTLDDDQGLDNLSVNQISPERELLAKQLIEKIQNLFLEDAEASSILRGMAEGLSPEEIQSEYHITSTQYSSAQRRIRRVIARTSWE